MKALRRWFAPRSAPAFSFAAFLLTPGRNGRVEGRRRGKRRRGREYRARLLAGSVTQRAQEVAAVERRERFPPAAFIWKVFYFYTVEDGFPFVLFVCPATRGGLHVYISKCICRIIPFSRWLICRQMSLLTRCSLFASDRKSQLPCFCVSMQPAAAAERTQQQSTAH